MIYVFMGKGGVGKTTLSVELAKYLQDKTGRSVLVVGIDRQNNAREYIDRCGYNLPSNSVCQLDKISDMMNFVIDNTFLKNFKSYVPLIAPDFLSITSLAELLEGDGANYDDIVIDFPPNHSGLMLVNMPNILNNLAYKAITLKNRVRRLVKGDDQALEQMEYLHRIVINMKSKLDNAMWIPVGLPQQVSLIEVKKLVAFLTKMAYFPKLVILNQYPIHHRDVCSTCDLRNDLANIQFDQYLEYCSDVNLHLITIRESFNTYAIHSFDDWENLLNLR